MAEQPNWSRAIESLGIIAREGSDLSNLAIDSHGNTRQLYAAVRQLLDLVQRLNTGRITADQIIAAATRAGEVQGADVERIRQALSNNPSQQEIATITQRAADAVAGPTPPGQPPVGGAKKRRRRGGYKRSPTSGEKRIVSGSTRRKRTSKGKRSKRSPTRKRTRSRSAGRRRR